MELNPGYLLKFFLLYVGLYCIANTCSVVLGQKVKYSTYIRRCQRDVFVFFIALNFPKEFEPKQGFMKFQNLPNKTQPNPHTVLNG